MIAFKPGHCYPFSLACPVWALFQNWFRKKNPWKVAPAGSSLPGEGRETLTAQRSHCWAARASSSITSHDPIG